MDGRRPDEAGEPPDVSDDAPASGNAVRGGLIGALAPLAIGLVVLAVARMTLLPGLAIWDTGEFQAVGPLLGTAHPTGYPAYVVLGFLASAILVPLGDEAFRMNLLSAALVALAAALVVVLVRMLTGRTLLAVAAALAMAAAPVAWRVSTRADAHALHLALLATLLVALVGWEARRRAGSRTADRWLVAASIVYGVSLANQGLTYLLAPGIGLFVLAVEPSILRRPRLIVGCLVAIVATAGLLYLELPLRAGPFRAPIVYADPSTWEGFWYVVLGLQFGGTFEPPLANPGATLDEIGDVLAAQLGPLLLLIPLAFVVTAAKRPRYALLTAPAAVLTTVFAASYINADIERYYLGPVLIGWTWIAVAAGAILDALGVPRLVSRRGTAGTGLIATRAADAGRNAGAADAGRNAEPERVSVPGDTVGFRSRRGLAALALVLAAEATAVVLLLIPTAAALPGRWQRIDSSDDRSAQRWVDAAWDRLERDAVVVSWWSYSTPLWYGQLIQHGRPDVWVVDDRTRLDQALGSAADVVEANLGRRPVYLVRINPGEMADLDRRYLLEPLNLPGGPPMLRVIGREGGTP